MIYALLISFFLSLTLGQIEGVAIGNATIYFHDLLLVGLLSIMAVKIFNQKIKNDHPFIKPLLIFIGAASLSLVINFARFSLSEIGNSSLYLIRWMAYAGLPFVVIYSGIKNKLWLAGLYLVGLIIALIGFFQYFLYPDLRNLWYLGWDPHYYRLFSTLLDPNFAGIILVLTLLLGFYLGKRTQWWFWVSQSGLFLAIILTYSRASYLALLTGLLIFILLEKKIRRVGLIGLICLIGLLIIFPKPTGEGGQLLRTVSTLARVGNYQRSFELIKEAPFFGWGFNTLRYVAETRDWTVVNGTPSRAAAGLDNSFLFVAATTGIVGLIAYLWLLRSLIGLSFHAKIEDGLRIVYISSYVAVMIHGMFNNTLFYPWTMIWLWILTGVIVRLIRGDK